MRPAKGPPGPSLIYSILVAVALFFTAQFAMSFREFATLDDQKMELEAQIQSKERKLEEYQKLVRWKERETARMVNKLHEMEFRLKNQQAQFYKEKVSDLPVIYAITPTYYRPVQTAELVRLYQTLMNVPALHWIIIEDSEEKTSRMVTLLKRFTKVRLTHLSALTPPDLKLNSSSPSWLKPKGINQRNEALKWLRRNLGLTRSPKSQDGVVYFVDDDNAYDLQIFEEMRKTSKVSVWPVGLVGGLMVERPIVVDGKVRGFVAAWKPDRPFPMDMAGFAVNLSLLLSRPEAAFTYDVPRGYQESHLLKQLVTMTELEPKADNCSKVLVWHTRSENPNLKGEKSLQKKGQPASDNGIEV